MPLLAKIRRLPQPVGATVKPHVTQTVFAIAQFLLG